MPWYETKRTRRSNPKRIAFNTKRMTAIRLQAEEIARRYDYDPARIERHARLLDVLDPGCAEAIREIRLPAGRRVA